MNNDRKLAIFRAKEAYKLFLYRGTKVIGFGVYDDHCKWFDAKTKYCVELELNGVLRKAFK